MLLHVTYPVPKEIIEDKSAIHLTGDYTVGEIEVTPRALRNDGEGFLPLLSEKRDEVLHIDCQSISYAGEDRVELIAAATAILDLLIPKFDPSKDKYHRRVLDLMTVVLNGMKNGDNNPFVVAWGDGGSYVPIELHMGPAQGVPYYELPKGGQRYPSVGRDTAFQPFLLQVGGLSQETVEMIKKYVGKEDLEEFKGGVDYITFRI